MNPNDLSQNAVQRLLTRIRKRSTRLGVADRAAFQQLVVLHAELPAGQRLRAEHVIQLHQLAEKCGA